MRTTTLMSLQFISLITMIGCAESLLCKVMPTILFVLSFSVFAACSIYISKHEKELIRDNARRYKKA
ncbi:MAG: hypothetical protein IKL54_06960 [Bacteroidaceae bacterium]|nr:hypothetical protein [Bacteroidaceae bacterium]MBR3613018.1 hypothetical protein [Bacteroidaceae bacterium]